MSFLKKLGKGFKFLKEGTFKLGRVIGTFIPPIGAMTNLFDPQNQNALNSGAIDTRGQPTLFGLRRQAYLKQLEQVNPTYARDRAETLTKEQFK